MGKVQDLTGNMDRRIHKGEETTFSRLATVVVSAKIRTVFLHSLNNPELSTVTVLRNKGRLKENTTSKSARKNIYKRAQSVLNKS